MRECVWRKLWKTKDILKIRLGEKWIPPFTARAAASLVNSSGTSSSLSLVLDLRSSLKLRGQTQVFPCFPATGVGENWKLSAMVTRRLRSLHCKRMVPTAASTQLRATSNHPMLQWFITVNLNQVSIVWHINWLNSKLEFLWKLKGGPPSSTFNILEAKRHPPDPCFLNRLIDGNLKGQSSKFALAMTMTAIWRWSLRWSKRRGWLSIFQVKPAEAPVDKSFRGSMGFEWLQFYCLASSAASVLETWKGSCYNICSCYKGVGSW